MYFVWYKVLYIYLIFVLFVIKKLNYGDFGKPPKHDTESYLTLIYS